MKACTVAGPAAAAACFLGVFDLESRVPGAILMDLHGNKERVIKRLARQMVKNKVYRSV